jgi:hypothetical protein
VWGGGGEMRDTKNIEGTGTTKPRDVRKTEGNVRLGLSLVLCSNNICLNEFTQFKQR